MAGSSNNNSSSSKKKEVAEKDYGDEYILMSAEEARSHWFEKRGSSKRRR